MLSKSFERSEIRTSLFSTVSLGGCCSMSGKSVSYNRKAVYFSVLPQSWTEARFPILDQKAEMYTSTSKEYQQ